MPATFTSFSADKYTLLLAIVQFKGGRKWKILQQFVELLLMTDAVITLWMAAKPPASLRRSTNIFHSLNSVSGNERKIRRLLSSHHSRNQLWCMHGENCPTWKGESHSVMTKKVILAAWVTQLLMTFGKTVWNHRHGDAYITEERRNLESCTAGLRKPQWKKRHLPAGLKELIPLESGMSSLKKKEEKKYMWIYDQLCHLI